MQTATLIAIAMFAGLLLPCAALAAWCWPSAGDTDQRECALATGLALGLSIWILSAHVLVATDALSETSAWALAAVLGLAAAAAIVVRVVRRAPRGERPSSSAAAGDSLPIWRRALVPAATTVGLGIAAYPFVRVVLTKTYSFRSRTSWYYYNLSREIAATGSLPDRVREWGTSIAPFDTYLGFNAPSAALILTSGDASSLAAARAMEVLAILAAVAGFYFFARSWGADRVLAVAAVFALFGIQIIVLKVSGYRPETLTYGLIFLVGALVRYAVAQRRRAPLVAAVAGFAALSQVHGVGATRGGIVVIATVVALVVVPIVPWGSLLRRAALGAGLLAAFALAWVVPSALLGQGLGAAGEISTLPERAADGYDPTAAFFQLAAGSFLLGPPGYGVLSPTRDVLEGAARASFYSVDSTVWLVLVAVVLIGLVLAAFRDVSVRSFAVFAFSTLAGLLILALYFLLGWDTHVPWRTGLRMLQSWQFVVIASAAVVLSQVRLPRRELVAGTFVGLALVVWSISANTTDSLADLNPNRDAIEALNRLHLPRDSVVLTNSYSEGLVRGTTGAEGLLDGQAPYLDADLLRRANRILLDTREYFLAPADSPFPFRRYGVDHVLVATKGPGGLGSSFSTDEEAVGRDPNLRQVETGPGFVLYEVVRPD